MSNTHFADDFDFENRIMDAKELPEDAPEGDNPLRPKNLDEYIGQEKVKENVMSAYKLQGLNRIRVVNPQVKTMLYTPVASMVGVTGSMAPFFCEFTINGDLLAHDYAASYAHEYAHLQGITSEGEANFYAYLATTQSMDKGIRFSGYYSILGHVFNNAKVLMNSDDYFALYESLRPEIKEMIESDRAYWQERYSDLIGEVQEYLYNRPIDGKVLIDKKIKKELDNYYAEYGVKKA